MAALVLRFIGLDSRGFWLDEAFSVWLAARPVDEIVAYRDFHPPLYYLVLRAWAGLGSWFASDAGLRLPSALASAAGVGLSVWLVQRLRLPGAGLVGALGATSALSVWYGQEARMFALAGFFALGSVVALVVLADRARCNASSRSRGAGWWLAYVVATALALYSGYDAVLFVAVANLVFFWLIRRLRRVIGAWLLANCLVGALYLPQLGRLLDALGQARSMEWTTRGTTLAGAILAWLGVLCALPAIVWLTPRLPRWSRALPAVGLLMVLDLIELTSAGTSVKRHVAVALPLLLLVAGVALASLGFTRRALGTVVVAGVPALVAVLFVHPKEDWRGAGALLRCAARPNDALVLYKGYTEVALRRYFSPPGRVVGVYGASDAAGAAATLRGIERVWLIESHADDPPTVALEVGEGRGLAAEERFHAVTVRRFDLANASPEDGCERPRGAS